ncbi:MAG TPA: TIGR00159 family protein [Eubacterium sp.]|nr:diadenylate cyclase CdaA [Lachnospiraceae bacterium]HBZ52483.1 TIGR00159 family protein [Eubacterium sp.]
MFKDFIDDYLSQIYWPSVGVVDVIEILIISYVLFEVMVWIKDTRAWALLKGILIIIVFSLVAILFNFQTILWIASRTLSVGIIALVVIFQPELRRALEQLGQKRFFSQFNIFDDKRVMGEKFNDATVEALIDASYKLGKTRTGALIVIEQENTLNDYINTGIPVDAIVSAPLLINIFEHNTPLHDGAVVVRGDRIVSATCYLPLSDDMKISKELGTRHRAAVGISEVTDALTIVVSEETGKVSVTLNGHLYKRLEENSLRKFLTEAQKKEIKNKPSIKNIKNIKSIKKVKQ